MAAKVRDNPVESRFELHVGSHLAAAYYRKTPGVITFVHTEVPKALAGQGIGSQLVRGALEAVRNEGLRVVPQCPFVAAYIKKHPEFNDLLNGVAAREKQHQDELLDAALEETFPASDPPAIVEPKK
jgi:uncharacterized protein